MPPGDIPLRDLDNLPPRPIDEDRYRVEVFGETDSVTSEDIVRLWVAEAGLPTDEARRRVEEVLLVAVDDGGSVAAVSTAYRRLNPQLAMRLWYLRFFTAAEHRRSNLAVAMWERSLEHITKRHRDGVDSSAAGIAVEAENREMLRYFPEADIGVGFKYIGTNDRGDPVRVSFFPGAEVPVARDAAVAPTDDDEVTDDRDLRVEVVRGRLSSERAGQILEFWSANEALLPDQVERRLEDVVCVLTDGDEVVGTDSVVESSVRLVGGQDFWVHRRVIRPATTWSNEAAMINAAYETLAAEFSVERPGPIGICVHIGDAAVLRRRPEPVWDDVGLMYVGYTLDGLQVRVRYFPHARIT